jgi:hypothetical protein
MIKNFDLPSLGLWPAEAVNFFKIYLFLPATLGTGVYSASHRNEHQKQKKNISGEQCADGT